MYFFRVAGGSVFIRYGSGSNVDPDPGVLTTKINLHVKKITFFIKKYNLPIPRPPKRTSKLQKMPFSDENNLAQFSKNYKTFYPKNCH
jgi:hypothetical protein